MKMYVFPGDESQAASDLLSDKPLVSRNFDAAFLRFSIFLATWTAGAVAAAFLAQIG